MATGNIVVTPIPAAVVTDTLAKIKALNDILKPYYVALSDAEKKHLAKSSDETLPFLEKGLQYAGTNPEFLPPFVNAAEMSKDFKVQKDSLSIEDPLNQMNENVKNLSIAAGSDTFIAVLAYYNSVKRASQMGNATAKAIYDDMSKRFPGRPPKNTPPA